MNEPLAWLIMAASIHNSSRLQRPGLQQRQIPHGAGLPLTRYRQLIILYSVQIANSIKLLARSMQIRTASSLTVCRQDIAHSCCSYYCTRADDVLSSISCIQTLKTSTLQLDGYCTAYTAPEELQTAGIALLWRDPEVMQSPARTKVNIWYAPASLLC